MRTVELPPWAHGVLDSFSTGGEIESAILGFVESEVARRDPAMDEHTAQHLRKMRWREHQARVRRRLEEEFERTFSAPSAVRVGPGRTYQLPEDADDGERREHALHQALGVERWA